MLMGLLSSRYRNYKENGQNYGTCFSTPHSHPPLSDLWFMEALQLLAWLKLIIGAEHVSVNVPTKG
jgi:hypothetical protein